MEKDRLEFWVRFVGGTLFGLLVGFYIALQLLGGPFVVPLGIILSIGLVFGVAAVHYGDRFWERILPILRQWL